MAILEKRMHFFMDAATKIMSKRAESETLSCDLFLSCAARRIIFSS
jgi:hypothetical protein